MLWYLSFAEDKPIGFLGVVIVEADSMKAAHALATTLGLNPGGQVAGWPVPDGTEWKAPPRLRNRLLTREELERELGGDCSGQEKTEMLAKAQTVCSHCNQPGEHSHKAGKPGFRLQHY